MAATFYSSFFSSGLLAPQPTARSQTPRPNTPTTPRAAVSSLVPDDTTPTGVHDSVIPSAADESQVLPSISIPSADEARPRLRRRRSSLVGAAASPLTNIKSSGSFRQAAASAQRSLRARAGSDASVMSTASASSLSNHSSAAGPESGPAKKPGIVGRLRSGSLGTALRSRRSVRRSIPNMPALPPPNAPLPAVPPLPSLTTSPTSPLPSILASPTTPQTPRRPLTHRAQTFDNYKLASSPFTLAGTSPMYFADDEDAFSAALRSGKGAENTHGSGHVAMQVDYPSPVDGAPFDWSQQQRA